MRCNPRVYWTIEFYDRHNFGIVIPRGLVNITSKPAYSAEYTTITDVSGTTCWIPGKTTFCDFSFDYVDASQNDGAYFFSQYASRHFNDLNTNFKDARVPELNALLRCWHNQGEGERPGEWGWLRETWDMDAVLLLAFSMKSPTFDSDLEMYDLEVVLKYQSVEFTGTPEYITVPAEGIVPQLVVE